MRVPTSSRPQPSVSALDPPEGRPTALSLSEQAALQAAADRSRVLVVGSLNMDYLIRAAARPGNDGSIVVDEVVVTPGGHAGNCASALRRLGAEVTVAATVGRDEHGDAVLHDLQARGIGVDLVGRVAVPTGRVFIPLFPQERFMLMERGANGSTDEELLRSADLGAYDAVVVFDPPRLTLDLTVSEARRHGRRTYWNPGGRYAGSPEFFDSLAGFDSVIVNRDEYAHIFADVDDRAPARLLDPGQELVLTLGPRGSSTLVHDPVFQPAPQVATLDETGAGDAFVAGYVLAELSQLRTAARLRFANAVGALSTRDIGARSCHATLPEALDLCAGPSTTAPIHDERHRGP